MARRILIIDGHPDPRPARLGHALALAYVEGARAAGHEVRTIAVAGLDLPLICSTEDFIDGVRPQAVLNAQRDVMWAQHLVIFHPLWLGAAPALLKGFFEQVFRYGFAIPQHGKQGGLLKGRTARIVVTMGMPAPIYRVAFGAFGVRSLARGVLAVSGIAPVRTTFFGGVETVSPVIRANWLDRMAALGRAGA